MEFTTGVLEKLVNASELKIASKQKCFLKSYV